MWLYLTIFRGVGGHMSDEENLSGYELVVDYATLLLHKIVILGVEVRLSKDSESSVFDTYQK